jgi:hypothetical protein
MLVKSNWDGQKQGLVPGHGLGLMRAEPGRRSGELTPAVPGRRTDSDSESVTPLAVRVTVQLEGHGDGPDRPGMTQAQTPSHYVCGGGVASRRTRAVPGRPPAN